MRKVSESRKTLDDAREECRKEVKRRDRVCQFPVLLNRFERETGVVDIELPRRCDGGDEVHEPAHSRNVDFTDPLNCILSCWRHNRFAEDATGEARELLVRIGWLARGAGLPYVKRISQ